MEWVKHCMAEFGFDLSYEVQSGATIANFGDVPPAQEGLMFEVHQECTDAPLDAGWLSPNLFAGEEHLAALYDFYRTVHDCMVAHGYPVTDPPSKEKFLEGLTSWHPYEATPAAGVLVADGTTSIDQLQLEIQDACPVNIGLIGEHR